MTRPLPERLTHAIIPLKEREGWVWRTVAWLWYAFLGSAFYRVARMKLEELLRWSLDQLMVLAGKLWAEVNARAAHSPSAQALMARIRQVTEWLKNMQGKKE